MRVLVGVLAGCAALGVAVNQASSAPGAAQEAKIAHGRYLVHEVAMCVQCHSPRTADGTLITDQLLDGGPIPLKSPYANQRWAFHAPKISGLSGYTDEEAVRLLTMGLKRDGTLPQAPMPPFRMSIQDAEAVVAYLRSVY